MVGNIGDSRAVLCRAGAAVELSFDHKPEDEIELTRIKNAGGYLTGNFRHYRPKKLLKIRLFSKIIFAAINKKNLRKD